MNILNFPNPYATTTQFAFELTAAAAISIDVYTLCGRRVVTISEESFSSGYNYINWDGRDAYGELLANGVYLYRLTADDGNERVSVLRKLAKFQ
jgi:flagellar hook assembly protein FlgD